MNREIDRRARVTARRTDRESQRSIVGIQRLRKEVDAPARHAAALLATRTDDEERICGFHSAALAVLSREIDAHRRYRSQKLKRWRESARLTETARGEASNSMSACNFAENRSKTYADKRFGPWQASKPLRFNDSAYQKPPGESQIMSRGHFLELPKLS
jgi:hypothetical protein